MAALLPIWGIQWPRCEARGAREIPGHPMGYCPVGTPVPQGEGVRTNFWDLDPVWERERERVNRDALTIAIPLG